jgi:hypothetical protein
MARRYTAELAVRCKVTRRQLRDKAGDILIVDFQRDIGQIDQGRQCRRPDDATLIDVIIEVLGPTKSRAKTNLFRR